MSSLSQTFDTALQFHRAGNLQQAESLYLQILQIEPHHVGALHMLGVVYHQTGNNELAIKYIQEALHFRPDHAEAYNNLANALVKLGKLEEAIESYKHAIRLKPEFPGALNNLGNALNYRGRLEEAIDNFKQALRLKPDYADAYCNLASALKEQGKLDEAIANYQSAIGLKPDHAGYFNNLGNALQERGRFEEAIANIERSLSLKPDRIEAYFSLGNVLKAQGKYEEAIRNYQHVLRLKPAHEGAYNNMGMALKDQGQCEEAVQSFQKALQLKPELVEAFGNLGNALKDLGRLEEAIRTYRKALSLKPEYVTAHDNLVLALHYHPDSNSSTHFQETQRWNERFAEPLAKYRQPLFNTPNPERRLRIGYVSPDFRMHPVSQSTVPLLSNHDREQLEIHCYADVTRPDAVTERLQACSDVWRSTVGLGDEQMAEIIRHDRIDILVDLVLHTANNRLLVFARKPAPVQVTWGGYPGTTGLSAIDYRLTDPYLDPSGEDDSHYSEYSVRLPDSFWCYDPLTDEPQVNELPALSNGFVTFGCLNNFCKVNDGVLDLWAQILQAVPRSRLLMLAPQGRERALVSEKFEQRGLTGPRVEFVDRQSRLQYFQTYHRIDLCLDPLPYNGHTTSLDSFWMGVPVISLIGKTVVGRAGWSQLCNLGLKELAAQTSEEYVALVMRLSTDFHKLQCLRTSLRGRMRASPLMDGKRFARHVELAFRQMWKQWCLEVARA